MAQTVHFWFFKSIAKILSVVKLGLCRGNPQGKKKKKTPAVKFRLEPGIPISHSSLEEAG